MVKSYLPENSELLNFESGYPGLSDILIENFEVSIDNHHFNLSGIDLKYDLSDIQVDKLAVRLNQDVDTQNSQPSDGLRTAFDLLENRLPNIDAELFLPLAKIQNVAIDELLITNQPNDLHVYHVNLAQAKLSQFEMTFSIEQQKKLLTGFNAKLALNESGNRASFQLAQQKNLLISGYLQINENDKQAKLNANLAHLQKILSVDNLGPVKSFERDVEFSWLQDQSNNTSNIQITAVPHLSLAIFQSLNWDASLLDKIPSINAIRTPLTISMVTQLDRPMLVKVNITGRFVTPFQLSHAQRELTIDQLDFELMSDVSLLSSEENIDQISFENTVVHINGRHIIFNDGSLNSTINDYRFSGLMDDTVGVLEHLDWRLKGRLTSPDFSGEIYFSKKEKGAAKKSKEANNFTLKSKLEADFELIKTENLITNGELRLPAMIIQSIDSRINSEMLINWQGISTDLEQGSASVLLESQNNKVMGFDFESLTAEANLVIQNNQAKGEGKLMLNQQALAPFSFSYDMGASNLSLNIKREQLANRLFNHFLAIIGKRKKMQMKILAGEAIHSGDVGFNKELLLDSEFAIKDMLFQFGGNQIEGLNLTQKLTSFDPLKFQTDISIEKISFSSGVDIHNISAEIIGSSSDDIVIGKVKGDLLEGQLTADRIIIDEQGLKTSVIQLSKISLTELIFFMDVPGLYAEGDIDLSVPLSMSSGSLTVDDGTFKARNEGLIKYSTDAGKGDDDENIALKALRNFHYKELDGNLSYDENGAYHIKLHLLGANPDLYDGYPIDFVLHLRGELTGIFRSLFLTGNFEDAVIQQVKADQLKRNE